MVFDAYRRNRNTGSFILVDSITNATVAAGMIVERGNAEDNSDKFKVSTNIREQVSRVSADERAERLKQKAATVWLTGIPCAGKTTIAYGLERHLFDQGLQVHVLDGENMRHGISENLGFSALDRTENSRRVSHVAKLCNDIGLITIVALTSPFEQSRQDAKERVGADRFLTIHIDAPVDACEKRDKDGLYTSARAGDIQRFTGVSAPYEKPIHPDLRIDTTSTEVDQAVQSIVDLLRERGLLK